jgi:3-dehydroquinate synthase
MQAIQGHVRVDFHYAVHFTTGLFSLHNPLLRDVVTGRTDMSQAQLVSLDGSARLDHDHSPSGKKARVLFVVDCEVDKYCRVKQQIESYFATHGDELELAGEVLLLPGGEAIKNNPEHVLSIQQAVNDTGLDRHSFLAVVGGGAILDLAGYAAATAHRGIRLIRIPTTTLSQNDSGVGVKNGINFFGKKNFIGTFAPAYAVLDDFGFLETLPDREWRAGIAEAVKVALIKDAGFFEQIESDAEKLAERDMEAMKVLIRRCAEMHVRHICTSGDAFEMGSSRPLDFGHWSAHKLEQVSNYQLRHGEAVAIGLALDVIYSHLKGWLVEDEAERVLRVLETVGFALYTPHLGAHFDDLNHPDSVFRGLREFREHLGGELTIQMLRGLGKGFNVHEVDEPVMMRAIERLKARHEDVLAGEASLKLAA